MHVLPYIQSKLFPENILLDSQVLDIGALVIVLNEKHLFCSLKCTQILTESMQ